MNIVFLESLGINRDDFNSLTDNLKKSGNNIVQYERSSDENVLKERVKDADILVIANMPLSFDVINSAKNLKMISVAFTGIDHVNSDACIKNSIIVCNASGYSNHSVAELAFGLMLSLLRKINSCDNAVRNCKNNSGLFGNELFDKTLGVIGTGNIGTNVIKIASAFGMHILCFSRTKRESVTKLGAKYVNLDELLKSSDIVSLHVPLTKDTKGLINSDNISLMKPCSVLINTSRGPVVDSKALSDALNSGKIAGAGIDVFDMEPPLSKDYVLLNAKNTVLTPHVAFATKEAIRKRAEITIDNIFSYIKGSIKNRVL